MEALWLATAGLVPILFAPPDFMVFFDVPKVALLRTLTGLMALLWAVEWAFKPRPPVTAGTEGASVTDATSVDGPGNSSPPFARVWAWTRDEPVRWAIVAAALFLAANGISTVLSPAFLVSLWGSNPGRDGYGLYNTASYVLLFLVIAAHLRSRPQLWRLVGIVATAATVASLYGVLQHYGLDPFHQGSSTRIQSSFGNPLFAASFLVMAIPITFALGLAHGVRSRSLLVSATWAAIVALQLAALMLTLSRGPWVALAFGMGVLLILVGATSGRGAVFRGSIALAMAVGIAMAVTLTPTSSGTSGGGTQHAVFDRAASIATEATTGGLEGRLSIWRRSASLIGERPWYDSEERSPLLARHLFGYGPELFLYTLPLRWAPGALEPVNASAHNYPIHLAVELGLVGLATYSAFVVVLMIAGGAVLLRERGRWATAYSVIYAALLASLAVRLAEQMTGVARVSDTALFWTIAAVLVAMPSIMRHEEPVAVDGPVASARRRRPSHGARSRSAASVWRWGVVSLALLAGTVFIWQHNVGYTRAAVLGSSAARAFNHGELLESLELMDRAAETAPDVESYYLGRARMMDAFVTRGVSDRVEVATEQYALAMRALAANRLSHTARLAAAKYAMALARLGQADRAGDAVSLYAGLAAMLPGHEPVYNDLASAHLIAGQPEAALRVLDGYADVNGGGSRGSAEGLYLRGLAYRQMGSRTDAVAFLQRYLQRSPDGRSAEFAREYLAAVYADLEGPDKRDGRDPDRR